MTTDLEEHHRLSGFQHAVRVVEAELERQRQMQINRGFDRDREQSVKTLRRIVKRLKKENKK